MNPIFQSFQNKRQPTQTKKPNLNEIIGEVQAGRIAPREKVLELLGSNPTLRAKIKQNLPALTKMAKQFGVSDAEVNAFITEFNGSV